MKKVVVTLVIILLGLVGVGLILIILWIWRAGAPLEEKLQALRAAGEPVTLAELAVPKPAPGGNAAFYLERARNDLALMTKELNVIADGKDNQTGLLADADRLKLEALLETHAKTIEALEQAGACSIYEPPLDYTDTPDAVTIAALANADDFRAVIRVLEARSRFQLAQGQIHEALQSILLIFRMASLYDGSLFLTNNLVANASRSSAVAAGNRVARAGPMTDQDRADLEAELARHDDPNGFIQALRHERAFGLSSYGSMNNWLPRAFYNNDRVRYLDLVQEQMDLASRPYAEFVTAKKKFKATSTTTLAALWLPAAHKAREARERVRGMMRCLRVLNALKRAGLQPAKGVPALTTLNLPAEAITDPFTEEPLHVKVADGQWLIYTVGPDLKDDGGDLANNKDFGVGPVPPK